MEFQEAENRYRGLEQQRREGRLSPQAYREALHQLRVLDDVGRLWMLQEHTGEWHVFDGEQWRPAKPPSRRRPLPASPRPRHRQVMHPGAPSKSQRKPAVGWIVAGCAGVLIAGVICVVGGLLILGLPEGTEEEVWETTVLGAAGGALQVEDLTVTFGPDALPEESEVRGRLFADVVEVATARQETTLEDAWLIPVAPIYEVELPAGLPLGETVGVSVPYDPALLGDADPRGLVGATWNGAWWQRWPSEVDTGAQRVTFAVDHFSPVTVLWEEPQMMAPDDPTAGPSPSGYIPRWLSHSTADGRFTIRYRRDGANAVLRDGEQYQSVEHGGVGDPSVPFFVRDLEIYLSEAWDRILTLGYEMPPQDAFPIEVRIQDLNRGILERTGLVKEGERKKTVDGATGSYGPLYIDNRLHEESGPRAPDQVWKRLKATATHELYHVVQRYNPSFPTWFYEASAVYLEWLLFDAEFEGMISQEYVIPKADFLTVGMWSGSIDAHYAKGAFLIYLHEMYGAQCDDVVVDGVYPFGGSSEGIYIAGLKNTNMEAALLGAARRCSGDDSLAWEEVFTDFAHRYYVRWHEWPTASDLVGSGGVLFQPSAGFQWTAGKDENKANRDFAPLFWGASSAAVWQVRGDPYVPMYSTLVFRLDGFEEIGGPQFWLYPYPYGQNWRPGPPLGPYQASPEGTPVTLGPMGHEEVGGEIAAVQVVGVMAGNPPSRWYSGVPVGTRVRAYFLPAPLHVEAGAAEGLSGEIEVRWEAEESHIPENVEGLAYKVYVSDDPADPFQQEATTRDVQRSPAVRFAPPSDAELVTVVLVDAYGNRSPQISTFIDVNFEPAEEAGTGTELDAGVVVRASMERLGYEEQPRDDVCTSSSCQFGITQQDEQARRVEAFNLGLMSGGVVFRHPQWIEDAEDADFLVEPTEFTYRGVRAITYAYRRSVLAGLNYMGHHHTEVTLFLGPDWYLEGTARVSCEARIAPGESTAGCDPGDPRSLYPEIDAILDEAARRGMIEIAEGN